MGITAFLFFSLESMMDTGVVHRDFGQCLFGWTFFASTIHPGSFLGRFSPVRCFDLFQYSCNASAYIRREHGLAGCFF